MTRINLTYNLNSDLHRHPIIKSTHEYQPGVYTAIMPGSVTATAHHVPQVVVFANGQRSARSGDVTGMCNFKWSKLDRLIIILLLLFTYQLQAVNLPEVIVSPLSSILAHMMAVLIMSSSPFLDLKSSAT